MLWCVPSGAKDERPKGGKTAIANSPPTACFGRYRKRTRAHVPSVCARIQASGEKCPRGQGESGGRVERKIDAKSEKRRGKLNAGTREKTNVEFNECMRSLLAKNDV